VDVFAPKEEEHRKWEGWIESRLRFLVLNLEQTDNIALAHPLPGANAKPKKEGGEASSEELCSCFFIGLSLNIQKEGPKTIDLTPAVTDFTQVVKEWPAKTATMDLRVKYVKRTELPEFLFPNGERPKPAKRKKRDKPSEENLEEKTKKQKVEAPEQTETEFKSLENVLNAEVEMATHTGPESIDISMENADQRPVKVATGEVASNGTHDIQTEADPSHPNGEVNGKSLPLKPQRSQSQELEFSSITEMITRPSATTSKKPTINLLK